MAINKVAVIGAGVMGAGIAAQLANAGIEVELLDRVDAKNPADRSAIAKGAIEKMLKNSPASFMHKKNAKKVRPGNTEDDMERLKECDLVIEAVFEDPKVKFDIFQKIDKHRKEGSIVASNTSTIPLKDLAAGQSEQFKKDFVITHFFNPPRYMPLLELVTSADNDKAKVQELAEFLDMKMGRGVVYCNDTPGFIANRIGTFWIQCAINEAFDKKLTIEEADSIIGRPMGVPKTGIFGLVDLVGLDLMPHIAKSLVSKLPADDGYCKIDKSYAVIEDMVKNGYTGRKGKGGFYRVGEKDANGERPKFSVDLDTGKERPMTEKVKMAALDNSKKHGLKGLVESKDKGGDYAWAVLKQTLCYTVEHAHTIAADITAVDQAMKLGYNWKYGPFELIDKLGVDYFISRLEKEGEKVPDFLKKAKGKSFYKTEHGKLQFMQKDGTYAEIKRPDGVLLLSDIKRASKPVINNSRQMKIPGMGKVDLGASVWDIGDGVLCLEFTSTGNSLDFLTMKTINKACDLIEASLKKGDGKYKALVIHNEGDDFSLGANLKLAQLAVKAKQYWVVEKMVKAGQEAMKRLKYASFPVVSAPAGKALGGGCEVLLHSSHVQAHAETYPGLVEVGVGLLPAWGGSTELLTRAKQSKKLPGGPMPPVATVFETISMAKVGLSAQEAKDLMILRETDGITMNKTRLLGDAKKKAIEMAKDYKPEQPYDLANLPGPSGLAAASLAVDGNYLKGVITPYDVIVSDKVAKVLTGGDCAGPGVKLTQDDLRDLERKHFMELVHDPRTINRIIKTLSGKGRKDYEKEEKKARVAGQRPQALRDAADAHHGFFARMFRGKSAKSAFSAACNENGKCVPKGLKKDPKPQVNWPKKG